MLLVIVPLSYCWWTFVVELFHEEKKSRKAAFMYFIFTICNALLKTSITVLKIEKEYVLVWKKWVMGNS